MMIKSTTPHQRIYLLLASSLMWLKPQLLAKQKLICHGHPVMLMSSESGHQQSTHCFCKWLTETLTFQSLTAHIYTGLTNSATRVGTSRKIASIFNNSI